MNCPHPFFGRIKVVKMAPIKNNHPKVNHNHMFIASSLLLLSLFALSFWILKESKVKLVVKLSLITAFFAFCTLLGVSLQTFMGWSANDKMIPKVVAIRHVVIKEPNQQLGLEGSIHLLIEHPPTRYDAWWLETLFGYKTTKSEPRLFRLPYTRELHEVMQNEVIPKNQRGQIVTGELTKGGKGGKSGFGKGGKGKGKGGRGKGQGNGEGDGDEDGDGNGNGRRGKGNGQGGYGGESLENEYTFHVLPPGWFLKKEAPE
jgi:hypothetical protein